jgi:hypothetical protein
MHSVSHYWYLWYQPVCFGGIHYVNSVGLYLHFFKLSLYILVPTTHLFHIAYGHWDGKRDYRMWRLYFLVIGIEILWNERNMYL